MKHYFLKISMIVIAIQFSLKTHAFVGEKMIDGIRYNIVTKGRAATVIGYKKKPEKNVEYVDIVIPSTIECEGIICDVVEIASSAFAFDGYDGWSAYHSEGSFINNIIIGDRVKKIGERAFYRCEKLTNVTFTNTNVLNVEKDAFGMCSSLKAVHIENIENWMKIKFENVESNPLGGKKGGLFLNGEVVRDLIIPNGVGYINPFAFSGCACLESVTIPNTVNNIFEEAFSGCTNVKRMVLPNSLISIWGEMFGDSWGTLDVFISDLESFCKVKGHLDASYSLYLNGEKVRELNIPKNIDKIENENMLKGIDGLIKVTIPHHVVSVGNSIFNSISELLSVVINCQSIGGYNFSHCLKLRSVTIGERCKNIGEASFCWCPELTDVFCFSEIPPECDRGRAFENCEIQYATLHVPAASIFKYENTAPWKNFGTIVALTQEETTNAERIEIQQEAVIPIEDYNLSGKQTDSLQKGVNIIRYSDGTTKKVYVK